MADDHNWQIATLVSSEMIATEVKSLTFSLDTPLPFFAGQHYSIRLTAEDGYMAQRDYSIANAPEKNEVVEFGIQLIREGEVSPYLFDLQVGDQVEIKGPIGLHFIWEAEKDDHPLLLIGGGSGMVPLRSTILHHIHHYKKRDVVFLISCKTIDRVLYQFELEKLSHQYPDFKLVYTFTQQAPENFQGYQRRVDQQMIAEVFGKYKDQPASVFVCGSTPFVEVAADALVAVGFDAKSIKTERFGGGGK